MLTEPQIQQFRQDGFLNYGAPVLTENEVETLRAALHRTLAGKSEATPDSNRNIGGSDQSVVTQIVNIWEAEPAFAAHLHNDRIVSMVAQLMDGADTLRVWHDQIQIKPPHIGGPTIWHQDFPYWPVISPPDLISAWVALEDADEANGCMSMVPRSHLWGSYNGPHGGGTIQNTERHGPAYEPSCVPDGETVAVVSVPVRAGSVAFHHCLTWHGAPPNHSDRPRPAIAVHYMAGSVRYTPQGRSHLVEEHITVAPGEILRGEHFPTVYEAGRVLPPPPAPNPLTAKL
ncbi:MAG: phytanoyl-CoA dioxygenase family protein [Cytophagales bacterium]|nr:phytanoyl-CoA dioxygenase family protein [Armatimonadota bacterium]